MRKRQRFYTYMFMPEAMKQGGHEWTLIPGPNGYLGVRKRSQYYWTRWCERAERALLTKAAPEVGALGQKFYMGCGFHYELVRRLGNVLKNIAVPEAVDDLRVRLINEVLCREVFKSIAKAKKTIVARYS